MSNVPYSSLCTAVVCGYISSNVISCDMIIILQLQQYFLHFLRYISPEIDLEMFFGQLI